MKTLRQPIILGLTLCVALLLFAGGATYLPVLAFPDPSPGQLAQPIERPGDIDRFRTALERAGFAVQEGRLSKFELIPYCCAGVTPSCYANNAGAPYMVAILPDAPGQTADDGAPNLFRLGANEAVILVGQTPPPEAYFSYQPFLYYRYSQQQQGYVEIAEPVGDTINNLTIQTRGPDPFDEDVIIVATADRGIDGQVRAAARRAGYPASILNTLPIPSAVTHLGIDEQADGFSFVHRNFRPQPGYEQALQDYLNTPQVVLRATYTGGAQPDPFPVPQLRVRGTGQTEMDLLPAVEDLRAAILAQYSDLQATELTTEVWLTDGYDGLQRMINQWAPTRDTLYLRTIPDFQLPDGPDDFVIVYGTNHEVTGKATYSNAGIYASESLLLGVVSEHSGRFKGSAQDYLPNHPAVDSLYAWKVARNCHGEAHCLEVKIEGCAKMDLNTLPEMWMGFRMYLEPSTAVGPAFTEVIYDRAIVFHAK